ncbi:MAG: EAL domain-containing protein, partial [Mesorhizobium sp.]
AEGVEAEAQLDMLRKAGCGEAQGFLIGAPARASEMSRLLRSQEKLRRSG